MIVTQYQEGRVSATVYGEFDLADFKEFEELVTYKNRFEGPMNLLMDLREMSSFTLDVAWKDLVFSRQHPDAFKRIAVLTESQWVAWSAGLSQIFVDAETRVFEDPQEAETWLSAPDDGEDGE